MTYLLIIFIVLVALAPVVWMKSSPKQQKVAQFRLSAGRQGLIVSLCKAPDAREDETYINFVSYCLPWLQLDKPNERPALDFLLVKNSRRGDPSAWSSWTWLSRAAEERWRKAVGDCLNSLSNDVAGLKVDASGITFYWQEADDEPALNANITSLKTLQTELYKLK